MSENRSRDFSVYDEMSTEELEEILRADFDAPEGEETDMDIILYVTDLLTERRLAGGKTGKTALEAYEEFKEHYLPQHKKAASRSRRWVRTLTTAAAAVLVVAIIGTVSANAFGFQFWKAIARWTQETFHFGDMVSNDREPGLEDATGTASLKAAMEENKDDPDVAPDCVPDGFEMTDLMVDASPKQRVYRSRYDHGDRYFKIAIYSHIDSRPQQFEQSEDLVEIYEKNGIIYYIVSNLDQLRAMWIDETYECYISGNVTIEELKLMIDSIEKG